MKAKETDYNFQIKHLNNEIEDAKNSLIKKENIIKESESVNAKYRKYKENLKAAIVEKKALMAKIEKLDNYNTSLEEEINSSKQKNNDNQEIQKQLATLEIQVKKNDQKLNYQKDLIDEKNEEIANVNLQNKKLVDDNEKLEKEKQLLADKLSEEKDILPALKERTMSIMSQAEELLEEKLTLQQKVKKLIAKLKNTIAEKTSMEQE